MSHAHTPTRDNIEDLHQTYKLVFESDIALVLKISLSSGVNIKLTLTLYKTLLRSFLTYDAPFYALQSLYVYTEPAKLHK
jgi:hypothetical protein